MINTFFNRHVHWDSHQVLKDPPARASVLYLLGPEEKMAGQNIKSSKGPKGKGKLILLFNI